MLLQALIFSFQYSTSVVGLAKWAWFLKHAAAGVFSDLLNTQNCAV